VTPLRNLMFKKFVVSLMFAVFMVHSLPAAGADEAPQPEPLDQVKIVQRLNEKLPLDTVFRNEAGKEVALGSYFGDRPVLLAFVYYECPMLCTLILNGIVRVLRAIPFLPGKDFEVVAISFDPGETHALAAEKKKNYLKQYVRKGTEAGWHFLTGDEESIRRVTEAAGFHYAYDSESDEYAHGSALMVLTPEGRLSRYFYGIEYPARDLRLSLVEASRGKIGSLVDQVILFCFHYDPVTGKYGFAIFSVLRLAGVFTVLAIAWFIWNMLRRERAA